MHKENKFLVNDRGIIEEVKVIFDDENNPYVYSFLNEDDFVRFDKDEKFFDNREQAEEYVKENIIPFDKTKSKSILLNYLKFMTSEIWMIFYLIVLSKSTRPTPFT